MKYFLTILALAAGGAIGVSAIVLGEGDDSPGLQGLGGVLVLGMIALGVRTVRQKRRGGTQAKLSTHEHDEDAGKND